MISHPPPQAAGAFLRQQHQVAEFVAQIGPFVLVPRIARRSGRSRWRISSIRSAKSSNCRISGWTRRVRRLSSSTSCSTCGGGGETPRGSAGVASGGVDLRISTREILAILFQQVLQRPQVVRHPGQDLLLGQPLGQRDLDRAVERQLALVDLLQRVHGLAHGQVAAQHGAAEPLAGDFDLLGQRDFFLARQQRNLGHLAEIHADRIVRQLGQILCRDGIGGAAAMVSEGSTGGGSGSADGAKAANESGSS